MASMFTPPQPVAGGAGTAAPSPPPAAPAARDTWIEVVRDPAGLRAHRDAWDDLARCAVEPNVFYEPWMLLPALETLGADADLLHVLVYRQGAAPKRAPLLCGLFPLERRGRYKGLPVRTLHLWRHLYCFLCTPLVRAGHARETLAGFFDWAAADPLGAALVELPLAHAEGEFRQALVDVLNDRLLLTFLVQEYNRAFLRRGPDGAEYAGGSMSAASRKELRRQRKRLGELGALETRVLQPGEDADPWVERFLALEASGWKGQERTALAAAERDRAFFTAAARGAAAAGQLHLLGLFLDGRPIALKCNFLSGPGGFTFKIAFDEAYAKYSPGVQLELDNIAELHRHPRLRWMDSCAIAEHFMINRLWGERRTVRTTLVATGRRAGALVVGLLPLARALRAAWRGPAARPNPVTDPPQARP